MSESRFYLPRFEAMPPEKLPLPMFQKCNSAWLLLVSAPKTSTVSPTWRRFPCSTKTICPHCKPPIHLLAACWLCPPTNRQCVASIGLCGRSNRPRQHRMATRRAGTNTSRRLRRDARFSQNFARKICGARSLDQSAPCLCECRPASSVPTCPVCRARHRYLPGLWHCRRGRHRL